MHSSRELTLLLVGLSEHQRAFLGIRESQLTLVHFGANSDAALDQAGIVEATHEAYVQVKSMRLRNLTRRRSAMFKMILSVTTQQVLLRFKRATDSHYSHTSLYIR